MKQPVILSVFGTRPEAIKLAPVVRALGECKGVQSRICVTAQHRQMLDHMLSSFNLHPDYDLNLMRENQNLGEFSARALEGIQKIIRLVRPDFVLVQGDTSTAFVTALAAFYERVPVGHVEAGLRSNDRDNPFPEEINRVMISSLARLHFAPTEHAHNNLVREGISPETIVLTGNTVVDALRWACARSHNFEEPLLREALGSMGPEDTAVVVTTHRRENLGSPLLDLCRAFQSLVERHPRLHLFYPVHMNPNVSRIVVGTLQHPRIHLLPTLDYFDLIHLVKQSRFVLTDSGGLQEEAPSLGKPVVVLREVTERPEAVAAGAAVLAGTNTESVVGIASRLLESEEHYESMARGTDVFGDGRAGVRIVASLLDFLGLQMYKPVLFASPIMLNHDIRARSVPLERQHATSS